jgi:soluble lytic murein transglycosylase-like protein
MRVVFLAVLAVAVPRLRAQPSSAPGELYAFNPVPGAALLPGAVLFDAARRGLPAPVEVEVEESLVRERRPDPAPFALSVPAVPPAPYARTFRRLRAGPRTSGYDALIRAHARRHGLDPRLVKAVIAGESEFAKRAISRAGARGLMQVMPATARELGVSADELYSPSANIRAGTAYLAHLFARAWKRYHLKGVDYRKAPQWVLQRILAAYNAGPRFLARRRLFRQTRHYVAKVLLFYRSAVTELPEAPDMPRWPVWTGVDVWRSAL